MKHANLFSLRASKGRDWAVYRNIKAARAIDLRRMYEAAGYTVHTNPER